MTEDNKVKYDRDTPLQPYRDGMATDKFGHPILRCRNCDYVLQLHIEQYCPICGQKLVNDEAKTAEEANKAVQIFQEGEIKKEERYITSSTYERAMKRENEEILTMLGRR